MQTKLKDFKSALIVGLVLGFVFFLGALITEYYYPFNEMKVTGEVPLLVNIHMITTLALYLMGSITFFRKIYKERKISFFKKLILCFIVGSVSMILTQILAFIISPIFEFSDADNPENGNTMYKFIIFFSILFLIPALFFRKPKKNDFEVLDN
jgi:hypothetical protein